MKTTNDQLVIVLKDLILINNDRIKGYDKAAANLDASDADLKTTFRKLSDQSNGFKNALAAQVNNLSGTVVDSSTNMGKIYRVWMDVKSSFASNDRLSALEACEAGEAAALKAYQEALTTDTAVPIAAKQLIMAQHNEIKASHDLIKKYRDMHAPLKS
ncbi:MAG: hypothetical protein RL172_1190 [Bacteroidota bacterium]|jgi:uncharacterized protein (TIGR02284 family)